ncbi:sensor histidine kinase [uncultured Fibrella sp.]|uniref:sensor histidine kinase n=1 Tax=uncultured Fibrella sp. TaxID=1284596 RepID=UPI0035CA91C0
MHGNRTAFWGISYRQLAVVLGLYGLSALFYAGTLTISQLHWLKRGILANFILETPRIVLDYSLKLLVTIPIWYLLFRQLRQLPLLRRAGLHLLLLPLFLISWQGLYYALSDGLHIWRLQGDGQVWDTYISALFYLVQFGIFHAYTYHHDLQQQRALEADLRQLALQSELSALKAQLNPHFLYNVFNTISASVPPAQERTRELLAELADLFRYQLQASKAEVVPVRDELAFVGKYLDLEKARFGDRLQVHIEVTEEVLDCLMPPMLLQPLVENSVRHGIATLIEGGEIRIRIQRQDHQLSVEVADTGVGLMESVKDGSGVGLLNTRLRLAKTYGSVLHVEPNKPRGVCIRFAIPLLQKTPSRAQSEVLSVAV